MVFECIYNMSLNVSVGVCYQKLKLGQSFKASCPYKLKAINRMRLVMHQFQVLYLSLCHGNIRHQNSLSSVMLRECDLNSMISTDTVTSVDLDRQVKWRLMWWVRYFYSEKAVKWISLWAWIKTEHPNLYGGNIFVTGRVTELILVASDCNGWQEIERCH